MYRSALSLWYKVSVTLNPQPPCPMPRYPFHERDTTRRIVVIQVNIFQNELMVEIYSKSLVRATGKVLLIKFS